VHWSFEPGSSSLKKLAVILTRRAGCEVELDAKAVEASGLTPDGPLPGVVIGGPITLRSLDELLLAPHGLGVAPSKDEKKLLITKRPATTDGKSYLQKYRAKQLEERLDRGAGGDKGQREPPKDA